MKERALPFSAPLVPRVLDDSKTQTRRGLTIPAGWQPGKLGTITSKHPKQGKFGLFISRTTDGFTETDLIPCPYGKPGDRLYVKEGYYQFGHWKPVEGVKTKGGKQKWKFVPYSESIKFEAPSLFRSSMDRDDPAMPYWHKRLGRFMPRKYSRITLEITDIRVERLNEISEADAIAEGVMMCNGGGFDYHANDYAQGFSPRSSFFTLWESINGVGSWAVNPWVWVIEFRRLEK